MTGEASAVDGLFRREAGRLIPALVRILGVKNLDLAEDVVQEVLCRALETWKISGIPDNAAAWLTRAARNRALDVIRRERTERRFAPDLEQLLSSEWSLATTVDELFAEHEIRDDQLRVMFSCCNDAVDTDAQVALVLHILCGFGAAEIAHAFLTTRAAVEKRLARAKSALRSESALFDFAGRTEIVDRLGAVHRALYLLFNEGYHSSHADSVVRDDLVREALRLALLLAEHPTAGTPASRALASLFCLHAARLPSRVDAQGKLVLLERQDRSLWNQELLSRGIGLLEASRPEAGRTDGGGVLSEYHLEAALAAEHGFAASVEATNWPRIVELYDALLALRPSPVVALNRAIAVGRSEGPESGLAELAKLENRERLSSYPFLLAAEADLLSRAGRSEEASVKYAEAALRARNPAEREVLERLSRVACSCLSPPGSDDG